MIWVLGASFKPSKEIIASLDLLPSRPGLGELLAARRRHLRHLRSARFFTNSLMYRGPAPWSASLISCSLAAYAFARIRFAGRNLLFTLMIGTLLLPYHVLLIPQYVLFRKLGLIDTSCRCVPASSWPRRRSSSS